VWYSNTQNDFSPGAAIFSLHTLASPSGRIVNYDEKQLTGKNILSCSFYLYRFRKYVSYGFPIISFCNPGVHYETPCIYLAQQPPPVGQVLVNYEISRSHSTTHHSRYDSSWRVISSSQRPLPDNTQHSQQRDIHAPGGIRTNSLSRRAAADLLLRQRDHWNRQALNFIV